MTAADELRRLLDERGITWWTGNDERTTIWGSSGLTWEYFNNENGDAWLGFLEAREQDISPEQAIAATLGRESYGKDAEQDKCAKSSEQESYAALKNENDKLRKELEHLQNGYGSMSREHSQTIVDLSDAHYEIDKLKDENEQLRELVRGLMYAGDPIDRAQIIENAVEMLWGEDE